MNLKKREGGILFSLVCVIVFSSLISSSLPPITIPSIMEYNSSMTIGDVDLNGTHNRLMNIKIMVSNQSGYVGEVTHNLTLRNVDGSFNYTLNGSFKSIDDEPIWIDFDTLSVPNGEYKMNVSAFPDNNVSDIKSFLTSDSFEIANQLVPQYSEINENPSNDSDYIGGDYQFSIKWIADILDKVIFSFEGVNTTITESSNNIFSISLTGLGVGSYDYYWWANSTSGDSNKTSIRTYVIEKATPSLSLSANPGWSTTEETETNITGKNCPDQLTCKLYRDGEEVSNPDIETLEVGTYVYVYNTTGNANYTSSSVSEELVISEEEGNGGSSESESTTGSTTTSTTTTSTTTTDTSNETESETENGIDESFWDSTQEIPNDQFESGFTSAMGKGERVKIFVEEEEHHVGVINVTNESATILVSSTPQQAEMYIGDLKKFDVTNDSYYDVSIELFSIENEKANLTIKSIYEEIPLEDEEESTEKGFLGFLKSKGGILMITLIIGGLVGGIASIGYYFYNKDKTKRKKSKELKKEENSDKNKEEKVLN